MFNNCNLSKWNADNVINISSMFSNCKSINSLPDISKWNTFNTKNTSYLFNNCEKYYHCQIYQIGRLIML